MDEVTAIKKYLDDSLGLEPQIKDWQGERRLAFYLRDQYSFYEMIFFDKPCLLLYDKSQVEQSPGTIKKHISQVMKNYEGDLIYVRDQVSSYNRKRLIERKIPFLIPGNQLYLPPLGLDLREYFKAAKKTVESFSPAVQVCVLYMLLTEESSARPKVKSCAKFLSEELGYSIMTISRALKDFESLGLGIVYEKCFGELIEGKISDEAKRELWLLSEDYLRNPVRKRHIVLKKEGCENHSGLTALAQFSMIAEAKNQSFAMTNSSYKNLLQQGLLREVNFVDEEAIEIEIWIYEPNLFARNGNVDRLSLYLSLKESDDERVQMALEEMMGKLEWS